MNLSDPHIKTLTTLNAHPYNRHKLIDKLQEEYDIPTKTTINSLSSLLQDELVTLSFSAENGHMYKITEKGKGSLKNEL